MCVNSLCMPHNVHLELALPLTFQPSILAVCLENCTQHHGVWEIYSYSMVLGKSSTSLCHVVRDIRVVHHVCCCNNMSCLRHVTLHMFQCVCVCGGGHVLSFVSKLKLETEPYNSEDISFWWEGYNRTLILSSHTYDQKQQQMDVGGVGKTYCNGFVSCLHGTSYT